MAITETIQAKEFTAGAPDITLKGDLRPNQMMASAPDIMDDLNQLSQMLFGKNLDQLNDDEYDALQEAARDNLAVGGRAEYGLGSLVKSIGKGIKGAVKGVARGVKKFAKSDLGKAAILAGLGAYAGGLGPFANLKGAGFAKGLGGNLFSGLSAKGKGTLASFAIGSLGSAVLSAAEAGGLDTSDPNAEVDLESLTGYLTKGYKNLNPNATDEEVFQFVQENTAEYRAMGGRIGYSDGSDDEDRFMKLVEELRESGFTQEEAIAEARERLNKAMGGRIGYDNGGYTFDQFMKDKSKVDQFMNEQEMRKLYEKMMREKKVREQKTMAATGGRIGYAMGTDDKVMMAAGIEGLPVRQNKAGVKELDLRETGGFIQPVGIKEKADDIPAMLSNNEFVFTADAVRAAGGGDVDKGAQLMYDTMKKLESKVV